MNASFPLQAHAAWTVPEITAHRGWIYSLSASDAQELLLQVRRAHQPGRALLDYRRCAFSLDRCLDTLAHAFDEAASGRGMALVRGLPREGVTPEEFCLINWAIGLYFGVARPQNAASAYVNEVKDVGGVYRSAKGRGYSSNAELDFHVDGSDVVLLACYNQAPIGGQSLVSSALTAFRIVRDERPELADALCRQYPASRNGEEGEGESPWYAAPVFAFERGRLFCRYNRNRIENALRLPGVPPIDAQQREAIEYLDTVLRRPDVMFTMRLEPGDLQLLDNHTMLHSRTAFEDDPAKDQCRTLYRLWLATPGSVALPAGWEHFWQTREGGTVRGGYRGRHYDDACREFDVDQAAVMGMRLIESIAPIDSIVPACRAGANPQEMHT